MEDYAMFKFFNQFIKNIKQGTKNIGIITDKDGTIIIDDSLKMTLKELRRKKLSANLHLIANSGRTVQDMINCLGEEDIPLDYFDYIVGDNGGMCVDIKRNKQLYKYTMNTEIVIKVINKFIEMGGNLEDIRLADGKNIFAYPSEDVKEYYKNAKDVVLKKNIMDLDNIDITKLTLVGSRDLIDELDKYLRENIKAYKTHIGKTTFPNKESNNYRLDFTRNAYKGKSST